MISAVLTVYKRQFNLQKQINSCLSQSEKVDEIIIWNNGKTLNKNQVHVKKDVNLILINSSQNTGVWSRFSISLICKNNFILVLDDDTIPGKDFCKNCLQSFKIKPGLYGSRGLRFLSDKRYEPYREYGWSNPNKNIKCVDIVGHSWFFPKSYLSVFWKENFANQTSSICGEDIHFSYIIQKYGNINTYVPPHPIDKIEYWGGVPETSLKIGSDNNAISQSKNALNNFDKVIKFYRSKGYKIILVDNLESKSDLKFQKKLSKKEKLMIYFPRLYRTIKKIVRKFHEN